MSAPRPPLPDQAERERFRTELERNFSVIAPAGVGKTTSIVDRVVEIARADRVGLGRPVLPRLVVVTYTKKAADEMFSRVRTALDREPPHAEVHAHLAQAFFGTIHSFCQRLLSLAGPLCGLPGEVEIVTDTARLWRQFRLDESGVFPPLAADLRRAFALHGKWEDVFALAEQWPLGASPELPLPGLPPRPEPSPVLDLAAKGRGADNIRLSQARLRRWVEAHAREQGRSDPRPCPEPPLAGQGRELVAAWQTVFAPLRAWRAEATRALAGAVAARYAQFRRRNGQFTFDDLVGFARQVVGAPAARDTLRQRGWRVILDEAQDTDPLQFIVLTELARPPGAEGCWLDGAAEGPRPGAFCMVGDPQQSIYSDRADLVRYLQVHERLLAGGGEAATFSVTMRCPVAVVEHLNTVLPRVLARGPDPSRQVPYVPLENPSAAPRGQCVRLSLPPPAAEVEAKAPARQAAYADTLAAWWRARIPADFGVASWNQVAILCPRNGWIDALSAAFQAAGLPVRQLSRRATRATDPRHAWPAALLTVFAHPRDAFELYGVLRDLFGHSDDALVGYIRRQAATVTPHPLRLDRPPVETASAPGRTLAFLHQLWREVSLLPLCDAVDRLLLQCQVAARLARVPNVLPSSIEPALRGLRRETAAAEARQLDLVAWARELRQALGETLEGGVTQGDALTLLTAHKAKGLGFDVVVLPFFHRRFITRNDAYPCFEKGTGEAPRVLFDRSDRSDTARDLAERRRRELHERLLYVALTRVKRTLLLLDDAVWWADLARKQGESWADLLQVDGPEAVNGGAWLSLPARLQPPPDPCEDEEGIPPAPAREEARPAEDPPSAVEDGNGPSFWRRLTPSSLQRHEAPAARVEPDTLHDERFPEEQRVLHLADPAAYGNWWHETMERAPWDAATDFTRHLRDALSACPDRARGAREFGILLESPILSQLLDTAWTVWTEVPFLWGDPSEKTGYEGYIDLLALNRETGAWLVVDWKTDRLPGPDPRAALLAAYAPQLEIYHRALAASLAGAGPGEAGLYSTVSGEWVPLGTDVGP
jgi:ATP-dependent helicase/nuclease subunit A